MSVDKRAFHASAPVPPPVYPTDPYYEMTDQSPPPPAYRAHHLSQYAIHPSQQPDVYYYQPTPPPQSVLVHSRPKKGNDACCLGCLAALCLCFGIQECC
ncbi:hypothetical protein CLU79DRAFT_761480 [Phycomyces nitens]|nr:hypothetical protein CLU79DRAFT_761480 [Phycomyces nitens]